MMKICSSIYLVFIVLGCSVPESLPPKELDKFIADEKNGLVKKSNIKNYSINVTYKPIDLCIYHEVEDVKIDTATYNSLEKKYADYYYFILSLSTDNKEALDPRNEGLNQYSELVQTLSFRMDQYVNLITSAQDTIPPGDFMLNRTYGLNSATNLLFAFYKEKAKGQEWIEFTLNEFGLGIGELRFRFTTKDLEDAPRINFEKLPGRLDNYP